MRAGLQKPRIDFYAEEEWFAGGSYDEVQISQELQRIEDSWDDKTRMEKLLDRGWHYFQEFNSDERNSEYDPWEVSRKLIERCLAIAEARDSREKIIRARHALIELAHARKDYYYVFEGTSDITKVTSKHENPILFGRLSRLRGEVHWMREDYETSLPYFLTAIKLYKTALPEGPDRTDIDRTVIVDLAESYEYAVRISIKQRKFKDAVKFAKKLLGLCGDYLIFFKKKRISMLEKWIEDMEKNLD